MDSCVRPGAGPMRSVWSTQFALLAAAEPGWHGGQEHFAPAILSPRRRVTHERRRDKSEFVSTICSSVRH